VSTRGQAPSRGGRAGRNTLGDMAETLSPEQVPARIARIREQLNLLADYL
jgi:hypothetical protein